MSKKRVLVAGATGYAGRYLVRELKKKGYWVRVLIRNESQKLQFEDVDDFFCGQISDASSLKGVCNGIDWVSSTIGITRQKDGMTYMDIDYGGNHNLLEEARLARVQRFQYMSAINGEKNRNLAIFKAKEKFVDELKASGLSYCIMRPNGFFSDMKDLLNMARQGRVYLFGHGEFKLNPIHGADLAQACLEALETQKEELSVGGIDTFSQNELATLALQTWQKPIKITHLPDWTRKCIIWLLRTFTSSKTYGPIEFFLTVMAADSIAPATGMNRLQDYFKLEAQKMTRG